MKSLILIQIEVFKAINKFLYLEIKGRYLIVNFIEDTKIFNGMIFWRLLHKKKYRYPN